MISVPVILTFALALFLTLLFPIMLILILAWKKKISLLPWAWFSPPFCSLRCSRAFLCFRLSPHRNGIKISPSFTPLYWGCCWPLPPGCLRRQPGWGARHCWAPESPHSREGPARPGYRTFEGALSFGLGHAFCEVILLAGLTHINNLIFCFLVSSGSSQLLAQLLPAGQLELVTAQLSAVRVPDILAGLLERLSAVLFHLFATSLVFLGSSQTEMDTVPGSDTGSHGIQLCGAAAPGHLAY